MGTWRTEKLVDFIQAPRYGVIECGYSSTLLIFTDRDMALEFCSHLNTKKRGKKEYEIIRYQVKPVDKYGKEA